jgi:hypothetical protein
LMKRSAKIARAADQPRILHRTACFVLGKSRVL